MANNTANTDWKLMDLRNTALFTFDSTNGWHPTNENQTPQITGEEYNIPWDNITQHFDYGLGARQITLQGMDVADEDVWKLSSIICRRQLMKLWVGEDWFYYVLGVEPRQIRDVSAPYQKSYTIGLKAVDPHYYRAKLASGSGSGVDYVVPSFNGGVVTGNARSLTVDLSDATSNQGTTYVEPCFWIRALDDGGTLVAATKVTITDSYGGQLVYSPPTPFDNNEEHIIMPWRNTVRNGFIVNDSTGFKLTANGKTGTYYPYETAADPPNSDTGSWIMDAFNHGSGSDDSATAANNTFSWIESERPCILSRNGSSFIQRNRYYPLALDGVSTNTMTATFDAEAANTEVYAQWCVRRV